MTSLNASRWRAVLRSGLILLTAFGLKLSADQVAAIQLMAESILRLVIRDA